MLQSITTRTCIVRNTAAHKGRTQAIEPGKTASRHLHYGRIILDKGQATLHLQTGEKETALICLRGSAAVRAEGATHELGRYDALYIPRDASADITPGLDGCDLAEIAAPVEKRHPVQLVRFDEDRKSVV